jgi:hypothetical protein
MRNDQKVYDPARCSHDIVDDIRHPGGGIGRSEDHTAVDHDIVIAAAAVRSLEERDQEAIAKPLPIHPNLRAIMGVRCAAVLADPRAARLCCDTGHANLLSVRSVQQGEWLIGFRWIAEVVYAQSAVLASRLPEPHG